MATKGSQRKIAKAARGQCGGKRRERVPGGGGGSASTGGGPERFLASATACTFSGREWSGDSRRLSFSTT
eukprot:4678271-Pyramimonas_sp.AAC.1